MNQTLSRTLPHVVLLPGNMCDARLWDGGDRAILKAIEAAGLTVSYVDFEDDPTIEVMAQRALGAHDGRLVPIGFSMGGIVALEMARVAGDRIAALCLIDTTSHADARGPDRLRQQQDVRDGYLDRIIIQELKPSYLAKCHSGDTALLTLLCEMAMDLGPAVFRAQSEALRTRADLTPVLSTLNMPVFVACGQEDSLCPPLLHSKIIQSIKHAQLVVIPDAGHVLPLEQPQTLADLIGDFLAKTFGAYP